MGNRLRFIRLVAILGFFFLLATSSFAQVQKVTTLAGTELYYDSVGINSYLQAPWGLVCRDSIIYMSDVEAGVIKRISLRTKKVTTIVNNQVSVNGIALSPTGDTLYFAAEGNILKRYRLSNQTLETLDTLAETPIDAMICTKNGSLIFSGGSSHQISMRTPQGVYSRIAGKFGVSGTTEGLDTNARFYNIASFALSQTEDTLFISDRFNSKIRRLIRPTRMVNSITFPAATGLYGPRNLTLSRRKDTLLIANSSNHTILRYAIKTNQATLWCGATNVPAYAEGTAAQSRFNYPTGMAVCDSGYLITDWVNQRIRLLSFRGIVKSIVGSGRIANGIGTKARYFRPFDIIKHPLKDTAYITDQFNHVIRSFNLKTHESRTLVGEGLAGNTLGFGTTVRLNRPNNMAISATGDSLYFVEFSSNRIKMILTKTGEVKWLAGSDTAGYVDKLQGRFARFNRPADIALKGNLLYVADAFNHKIRTVNVLTTEVKTYAGSSAGFMDSTLLFSRFNRPITLEWVDNRLFVGEDIGLRIRVIDPVEGKVRNWAGSGNLGLQDEYGSAAKFMGINKLSFNPLNRKLYLGGYSNDGNIRTIGVDQPWVETILSSQSGYVDGNFQQSKFKGPQGYCLDWARKRILVADDMNNRIRGILIYPNTGPQAQIDTSITFLEDAGLVNFNGFAQNMNTGQTPGDTLQEYFFSFAQPVDPRIAGGQLSNDGNLQIQSAPDSNGHFYFKIRMKDNGGTAMEGVDTTILTTRIQIIPVNDPPVFSILGNDTAYHLLPRIKTGFITNLAPGPYDERNQNTNFTIIVDKPERFLVQPFIDGEALRFTPKQDSLGPVQAQIRCSDNGGTANGGIDTSVPQNFTIFIWDPVMVKELKANRLAIYPNPGRGRINFVNLPPGTNGLRFTNSLGQLVWEGAIESGQTQIHLPDHVKGLLYVQTTGGSQLRTGKVVIH